MTQKQLDKIIEWAKNEVDKSLDSLDETRNFDDDEVSSTTMFGKDIIVYLSGEYLVNWEYDPGDKDVPPYSSISSVDCDIDVNIEADNITIAKFNKKY